MVVVDNAANATLLRFLKALQEISLVPKIKSVIAALTGFYKNSKREVSHILKDIFNLDISLGSISNSEARVAFKMPRSLPSYRKNS